MKKLAILACTLATGATLMAQGTINFANLAAGVNAPITDIDGTTKLAGTGFLVQLFAGPQATSLTAIGTPAHFGTGATAGYFLTSTGGGSVTIPGVTAGSSAWALVRAWDATAGATWDVVNTATAKWGVSNGGVPFATQPLGGGALPPPNLVGLNSFSLTQVPEPATFALLALGAGALLIRRRK